MPHAILAIFCLLFVNQVQAHVGAFAQGMYCQNGPTGDNLNSGDIVKPLFQLTKRDWFFHHVDKCDERPPPPGEFLELPAGGQFTVELATNQAKTTLSHNGRFTTEWPDGSDYPDNYNKPGCITEPNLHTQNETMAAGTAFAISYHSRIQDVTSENLVVFSVRLHTPFKRVTTYDVPAAMPKCPEGGCHCAWGWIPNGCGEPNMYHQPFRCNVINVKPTSIAPVGVGKPPVFCEEDPSKCVKGPKQMLYWNQKDGNNIQVSGPDRRGFPKSPGYNAKCGFSNGAQNDIFVAASQPAESPAPSSLPSPSPTRAPTPLPSSSSPATPSLPVKAPASSHGCRKVTGRTKIRHGALLHTRRSSRGHIIRHSRL